MSSLKSALASVALLLLLLSLAPTLRGQSEPLAALQTHLSNHLAQPKFAAAAWGVRIAALDSGRALFDYQGHKLLKPASNAKLFTGALALDRLGPDFRIRTSLYAANPPDRSGTLRGDLIVFGRGDPSFSERFDGVTITNVLEPLVQALVATGVKRITGDLIGDESYFRGPPLGSEWTWADLQQNYGAEASALTVQDNVVDLVLRASPILGAPALIQTRPPTSFLVFSNRTRTVATGRSDVELYRPIGENLVHLSGPIAPGSNVTDAVAVHRPALWFVTLFKEALARRGIKVSGKVRAMDWLDRQVRPLDPRRAVPLTSVESRPLSEILKKMMKPSQNLYAHLLLLQVGARRSGAASTQPGETNTPPFAAEEDARAAWATEDIGLAELRQFLAGAGVPRDGVRLDEGSGLSRAALVTPEATVELLRFMHRHRHAAVYRDALPVAGVDGTLRNRMKATVAARNVQAKTGTLRYVNTLSGYVTTKAGEELVFSLMLNNYDGKDGRAALDAIAILLAEQDTRLAP